MKTPREVRNALRYVLLNRKHHAAEKRFFNGWLDPFSSGVWFRGRDQPIRMNVATRGLVDESPPTAEPRTWLLRAGWRRAGPLSYDDRPA